ncbi:MAG: PIN domain-containing protein [Orrella sp.]|jgi:hypothetical protein|uniref:PIN domain-containing protein n=1 Tax=Orrella sp. TaxID=1921583 RepID=UPI003BE4B57C
MPPSLVLDACVLMSGVLRPLLLTLAHNNWFEPVWSDRIGSEWRRNAARIWPIQLETLEQAWQDMQAAFPLANSSTWPNNHLSADTVEPALRHSDHKDWHVIMAGIQAKQLEPERDVTVVTWNIKDFRRSELRQHGLNLIDPDRLLSQWWATQPDELTRHLKEVIESLIRSGRRQPEPLEAFLKRERLFRLGKLYQGSLQHLG